MAWQSQKIPMFFFLQSCIAFGKTPDVEEGMSLRVRMQPRGRAWSEDVYGNF